MPCEVPSKSFLTMPHLYALLVGIDGYLVPQPLNGCVADVRDYEEFLRGRIDHEAYHLHLRTLIDADATRTAVLAGLREHLGQAGPKDSALFVFCGHGSQQPSLNSRIEPDGLDETLVCYDSRLGGSDLADKEIARWLEELSPGGAHILVILDCCHSGSGTRDGVAADGAALVANVRSAPRRFDPGPAGYAPALKGGTRNASGWMLPAANRHVLMAACGSAEKAAEVRSGTRIRGAFSLSLLETLRSCPAKITYSSLLESLVIAIRDRSFRQTPQLEAIDPSELDLPFLGGGIATRPRLLSVNRQPDGRWRVNIGAMHGIPAAGDPARILLFPRGTSPEQMRLPGSVAGRAVVTQVFATTSCVSLDFTPQPADDGFDAFLEWVPFPPAMVVLAGLPEPVKELRRAISVASPAAGKSPYVAEGPEGSPLLAMATPEGLEIFLNGQPSPVSKVSYEWPGAAAAAVERLEHVACWRQIRDWGGPDHSSIRDGDFVIELLQGEQKLDVRNLRLEYYEERGSLREPGFVVRVANRSNQRLWFALMALTESFGIVPLLEEQSVALDPGQFLYARRGEKLCTSLPDWLLKRGGTETEDILRVMVSTAAFDGRVLRQPPLGEASARSAQTSAACPFTRLGMPPAGQHFRNIGPEESGAADDWKTIDFRVRTVRAHPWQAVGASELELPTGILFSAPSGFGARLRLSSKPPEPSGQSFPAAFDTSLAAGRPFRFLEPCGNDPGLDTLELRSISGSEFVRPGNPLRITLRRPLDDGQWLLPFTFAGGSFLALGERPSGSGQASILIKRLPAALGDLVRIAFRLLTGASQPGGENILTSSGL